jgi:hypothetical protein
MFNNCGKTKVGLVNFLKYLMSQLKVTYMLCHYLLCGNVGDHMHLKDLCKKHGVEIKFIPQKVQNSMEG